MEALSEELKDNQYYVDLLDALVEENDREMKHRLQRADTYAQFIHEQAEMLLDDTIAYIRKKEVSFPEASSKLLSDWSERMFS